MAAEPKPTGRPSDYTDATADTICQRLIEGESLRTICRDDDMPNASTVCRWLGVHETFRKQYALAREAQADTLADESLEIADDGRNDWVEKRNAEGGVVALELNREHVQRSKLRIEQRRWYASKLAPKKYGDRLELDATVAVKTPSSDPLMAPDAWAGAFARL